MAPVLKTLELNAALRYDYYTDAGAAWTPKFGAKWKAIDNLALRGTYSKAFRAPSSTENSATSVAAFGGAIVNDNARCASLVGLPQATIDANCLSVSPTFVQRGNPDLKPEKATSTTLGLVWDITAKSSVTADLWQIKRTGLPVIEDPQAAVDAGRVVRDPATKLTPRDLGAILNGSVVFQNSSKSLTEGFDIEAKARWTLPSSYGSLTTGVNWTHLITQSVTGADGVEHEYAGTHGDCNITNCMGSPRDRVSLYATWEMAQWRVGANINYRGDMTNKTEQSDAGCAQQLAERRGLPGRLQGEVVHDDGHLGGVEVRQELRDLRFDPERVRHQAAGRLPDLRCDRLQPARLLGRDRSLLPDRGQAPVLTQRSSLHSTAERRWSVFF